MKPKRLLILAVASFIAAGPAGGFVFGFLSCSDCGWNIAGRLFIGCVMAFITPLSGGFPPQNEGGVGPPFNAWPYIIVAGLLIFCLLVYRERRKTRKEGPNQSPQRNAGSRPSSDDSSTSETPSSLGPRG